MNMFQYNIILKVVMEITKYLGKSGLTKGNLFEEQEEKKQVSMIEVWKQFFRLAAIYIQSKVLNGINWGSEAKQKEVNEKHVGATPVTKQVRQIQAGDGLGHEEHVAASRGVQSEVLPVRDQL